MNRNAQNDQLRCVQKMISEMTAAKRRVTTRARVEVARIKLREVEESKTHEADR